MAYVVARRDGRFEIRESLATERGPRARSLANFAALTLDVLEKAESRASRPLDRDAVIAAAAKRGAVVADDLAAMRRPTPRPMSNPGFVETARRFAAAAEEPPPGPRMDPGRALEELLEFADAVTRHKPPRPMEPLGFPVLKRLAYSRHR